MKLINSDSGIEHFIEKKQISSGRTYNKTSALRQRVKQVIFYTITNQTK